ncbi:MAG: hypothetical protein JW776_07805 [Candidatus Lokiarchaeota archaeon]|nr:hypothetical protein [Candidatus Lokiarchaeota archaeon]
MFFSNYKQFYLEDGTFDLKSYRYAGHGFFDVLGEIILILVFGGYYAWGVVRLVDFIKYIQTQYEAISGLIPQGVADLVLGNAWQVAVAFIAVYILTLGVNYLIVRFFSKWAAWFMYGTAILQMIMFGLIFYYLSPSNFPDYPWWLRWIFLVPLVLQIVIMTIWHKKFALAVEYTKMSCLVVWQERKLLVPQFVQTFWIFTLLFFHFVFTANTFLGLDSFDGTTIEFYGKSIEITETWAYIGYSVAFVFLVYIVIFVTLTMKINMVHHWYRGGNLSWWHAWGIARRRWWAVMTYAFTSTIIHSIKFVRKLLKKEIEPKNLFESLKTSFDLLPENPMALEPFARQKRKAKRAARKGVKGIRFGLLARLRWRKQFRKEVPLYKRIWLAMNYFTLPAISIEDKPFFLALPRSLHTVIQNIPDLYIKQSNVNKLFKFIKFASIGLSALLGGTIAWIIGYFADINKTPLVIVGAILFGIVGSMSSLLVLNDLNMSYITLMYIHTIDKLHGKEGYTRFDLEPHEHIQTRIEEKMIKRDRRRRKWGLKRKYEEELDASKELSDFQPEVD